VYRLGCLWAVPTPVAAPYRAALEAGLKDLGWLQGQNIVFEHRFPNGPEDFPQLATSLVAARVDAIAAMTNPVVAAAASATSDIPIVGVYTTDPVSSGFAMSLPRPGKNITGITMDASPEVYGKQLELLKQMVPRDQQIYSTTVEGAARSLQLEIHFSDVRNASDIEQAFRTATQRPPAAIYAWTPEGSQAMGPISWQCRVTRRPSSIDSFAARERAICRLSSRQSLSW